MDRPRSSKRRSAGKRAAEAAAAARRAAIGGQLREARLRAGLTQEELAAQAGRQKNWLSDIERGRRGIDPPTLQGIADFLGRSIEFFTNPRYRTERKQQLVRPATREDWELLYEGEAERAAAHASLDEAFERARRLMRRGGRRGAASS